MRDGRKERKSKETPERHLAAGNDGWTRSAVRGRGGEVGMLWIQKLIILSWAKSGPPKTINHPLVPKLELTSVAIDKNVLLSIDLVDQKLRMSSDSILSL